jgi:ribosomal protein S8
MSAPTNLKEWKMPEPKPQPKPKPRRRQELYTNQVNFSDSYEQTIDTYKQKGYVVTLNYLKQLFRKNKITMTTKNQLVNVLTTIHMMDRKTRKRYFNGYVS